ncbi:MAG: hypothetical protein U0527_13335 [Candidatus Eisenbacteria bacterium]
MTAPIRPRGPARASLFGVIERGVALWLWETARPESLPVPPLEGGLTPIRREEGHAVLGPLTRVISWTLLAAAVLVLAIAALEARQTAGLARHYQLSPGSMSLASVADHIEGDLAASPVAFLYPDLGARGTKIAARVREGLVPLERAAESYRVTSALVNELGLPGRLLMGRERVAPLVRALREVRSIWHQETTSFKEMEGVVQPYLMGAGKGLPPLRGVIKAATADHAVSLTLFSPDGARLAETLALEVGDSFQLPLVEGATLVMSALVHRPGEPYQVVEDLRIPLAVWSEEEISFPHSGTTLRVDFNEELNRMAPRFPPLSAAAREELAL